MNTKITHIVTLILMLGSTALLLPSCASRGSGGQSSLGAKPYPRKLCLVTENDLGSMGDEQRIVHQGQELKFCCAPCVNKFKANPAKYLAKLSL